jgi:DNA-binding MarR family transcriptional regulator
VSKPLNLPFDPIERAAERWEDTWGPASAMRVATSIMRAQQILLGRYDELLKPRGLTFARYEVLVLLRFSRYGALPLGRIGERLMVHPTSVTNSIDRLEKASFVERRPNPRDGRGTLAAITETGRAVVEVATKDLMDADFGLGAVSEPDRRAAVSALRNLRVDAGDFRVS